MASFGSWSVKVPTRHLCQCQQADGQVESQWGSQIYATNETETATPSYTLLNVYMGNDIKCHGKRILSLYLSGENLTNRAYQSHLSRLKYLDRNNVTGRMGVYNMGRNFSVKAVVPIDL